MALSDQVKDAVFRYIMGTEIVNSAAIAAYFAGGQTSVSTFFRVLYPLSFQTNNLNLLLDE